ncbi:MAG: Ca2+-dependent phosphoinositide-specific phospholipase C [Planctomycetota bacterium]
MSPELRPTFIVALTILALGCHSNNEIMAPPSPGDEQPTASPAVSRTVGDPSADRLRLNHLQVKGTHNSYHRRPAFSLVREHAYEQAPLDVQLQKFGVRVVELDIHPSSRGYEVYHLPLIDSRSTCGLLVECLEILKKWSDSNPGHHPLFVWIEPKDELGGGAFDMDALDEEILSVWPRERLVTPALVRGGKSTLREAIEDDGWPDLDSVRNRAMFMLLDRGRQRKAYLRGRNGAGGLEGRIMFVLANPDEFDEPFAAVAKIDNPASRHIPVALGKGIIVGSNVGSASGSDEGNFRKLQAGLEGGVHLLTGDFPAPVKGRSYWFRMPGGRPSRCNPVTAPPGCSSGAIENLSTAPANSTTNGDG